MLKCLNVKIKNRGFTLLEVIIAVFLLTVGIVGAFVVINKTISLMAVSPSKIIAAYLAQEGIEIVKNIRDTNWIEGGLIPWDDGLADGDYEADYDDTILSLCPVDAHGKAVLSLLNIDAGGFYSYSSGDITKFRRKINIDHQGEIDSLVVSVQIDWAEKGKPYSFSVQENLYNWH